MVKDWYKINTWKYWMDSDIKYSDLIWIGPILSKYEGGPLTNPLAEQLIANEVDYG